MSKTPLKFAKKKPAKVDHAPHVEPWHVLVVDDEAMIHEVTRLSLKNILVDERPVELHSCYSGAEARDYIGQHDDIALILLDVVMETNDSGLRLVEFIRNTLKNHGVRIVLRTGQPGDAPEESVIEKYDINDYKEKTELTRKKLYTLLHSSLRAYDNYAAMQNQCKSMENILNASTNIISKDLNRAHHFIEELLHQTQLIFGKSGDEESGSAALKINEKSVELKFTRGSLLNLSQEKLLKDNKLISKYLARRLEHGRPNIVIDDSCMIYELTYDDLTQWVLFFQGMSVKQLNDQHLASIFAKNSETALRNIELINEIETTQKEIVYLLGEAVESRSKETGNHVRRVCSCCEKLALLAGVESKEAALFGRASALHDIGKVAIPDNILHKPGRLTPQEREIMCTHAQIGYNILKSSSRSLIKSGAIIAHEHHECWDGTGYPLGKKALEIHLYGRIAAIIDVFDALSSKRCYKEIWPRDDVYTFMEEKSGVMFDPALIKLLLMHFDEFYGLVQRYQ
jgi:response regulator RpfG family c-di-GMP phosphodiesterase